MMPYWTSPRKDRKYRGDRAMEAKIFTAVTGEKTSMEDIEKTGRRIFTLLRALTARFMKEKDLRTKHDLVPSWVYEYPKDKDALAAGTNKMDRKDIDVARDMLYAEFGWDKTTGVPTRATLKDLGLDYVADTLEKEGLLPA
jgi:aldehyde:ferredoxin oxidoreductase